MEEIVRLINIIHIYVFLYYFNRVQTKKKHEILMLILTVY